MIPIWYIYQWYIVWFGRINLARMAALEIRKFSHQQPSGRISDRRDDGVEGQQTSPQFLITDALTHCTTVNQKPMIVEKWWTFTSENVRIVGVKSCHNIEVVKIGQDEVVRFSVQLSYSRSVMRLQKKVNHNNNNNNNCSVVVGGGGTDVVRSVRGDGSKSSTVLGRP